MQNNGYWPYVSNLAGSFLKGRTDGIHAALYGLEMFYPLEIVYQLDWISNLHFCPMSLVA